MPASDPSSPSARILYLSYDGMTDPLGRSQVLPYLVRLSALGHDIRLLSLDKPGLLARDSEAVRALCRDGGVDWRPLPFRSRPPVVAGWRNRRALRNAARRWLEERPADILHARSDLAASAALPLAGPGGPRLLWDMRALWADERVDSGAWDQRKPLYRALYRHFRKLQALLVRRADAIVTLAEAGERWLADRGRTNGVTVIPCCADFDHFRPDPAARARCRAEVGVRDGAPLLLHLGSIGGNALLDEMLAFFTAYRRRHPDAALLFLAPGEHDRIRAAADSHRLGGAVHVRAASRDDVPGWTAAADLGVFFVRPAPSKVAASPTKLGEMLAAGLPVVTGPGVGDVEGIVRDCAAGVVVDGFTPADYEAAIAALDAMTVDPDRIRHAARRWFDVDEGVRRYDALYRALLEDFE